MSRMICAAMMVTLFSSPMLAADPWADTVVDYNAGDAVDFTDPSVTLGSPSRTTWESVNWPSSEAPVAVRMTEAPWIASQICKIGTGGYLVVGFDEPVGNDAANPFGIDLLVFGNRGLFSTDWPANENIGAGSFGGVVGDIQVSQDGLTWYTVTARTEMYPTQAYASGTGDAFSTGADIQSFYYPVDPTVTISDLYNQTVQSALDYYGPSGGGMGIDLDDLEDELGQATSLGSISYVKVLGGTNAIDAFADATVPEPATMGVLLVGAAALAARRHRR